MHQIKFDSLKNWIIMQTSYVAFYVKSLTPNRPDIHILDVFWVTFTFEEL